MKKTRFLILAGMLIAFVHVQQAAAQNTSPYWSLAGNSNATSSSKLGTTNAIDLRLMTNNTERIRILNSNGYVGIGTTAPGSRLQINAASGTSPLKVQINSSTKLYMNSGGGLSIGSGSSAPSNGLYVAGNVGIGTTTPSAKLQVNGSNPYAVAAQVNNGELNVAIPWSTGDTSIGIRTDAGTGIYATGMTAVQGEGMLGIYGSGYQGIQGTGQDFGVAGYATNDGYDGNGIYGQSYSPGYAGYFDGDVYTSGSYLPSDRTLKQNIADVTGAMAIIGRLQPKTYEYRQDGNYKLMHLPEGTRYGLIAQDVAQVLPGIVKANKFQTRWATPHKPGVKANAQTNESISFQALNYTELIPIIVKALQEQTNLINQQQQENNDLKARVAKLEELVRKLSGQSINMVSSIGALGQATPNPASGTTRISYSLPAGTNHAQLLITDAAGKTIKALLLNGTGTVDVNTASLSSGVYNYSLLVDGNIVAAKKMEVAR